MGWTAYYQILRDRPLDEAELVVLDEHITRTNRPAFECEGFGLAVTREARADRVLGYGWTKVPQSTDESEDHQRLCDALTALPRLIPGVEVRVSDDYECFGWDEDSQAVTLDGPGGGELVDLDDAARAGFVAPSTLVAPRFQPLAPAVEALVGGGDGHRRVAGGGAARARHAPRGSPGAAGADDVPGGGAAAGAGPGRAVRLRRHLAGVADARPDARRGRRGRGRGGAGAGVPRGVAHAARRLLVRRHVLPRRHARRAGGAARRRGPDARRRRGRGGR